MVDYDRNFVVMDISDRRFSNPRSCSEEISETLIVSGGYFIRMFNLAGLEGVLRIGYRKK